MRLKGVGTRMELIRPNVDVKATRIFYSNNSLYIVHHDGCNCENSYLFNISEHTLQCNNMQVNDYQAP